MYLYPKWIRAWHMINALMFIILIATGLSMQYTDKDSTFYMVGFAMSVRWHNFAAIVLTINYIIYVTGNVVSKNGQQYAMKREGFAKDLVTQAKFYMFGMFSGEKHPFPVTEKSKFNPLQKITYVLAMYVAFPLLIISGIGLFFPEITIDRFFGVSRLILTDVLHITMGFFLSIFMIVHIYTCTLGKTPLSLFKGMITGYHDKEEEH
jgi:thiosulfate reductase cytochrome b subunit